LKGRHFAFPPPSRVLVHQQPGTYAPPPNIHHYSICSNRYFFVQVDVNAMGFFGALLAPDTETLAVIKRVRPFNILTNVVPTTV
jgi:hypothetical protein